MSYYGNVLGFLVWFAYYYRVKISMHWRPWHSESSELVKLKQNKTFIRTEQHFHKLALIVLHSDVVIWERVSFGTALWENNKPQKQWTLVLKHQSFMRARTDEIYRGFKFRRVSWQQKCLNSAFFSILHLSRVTFELTRWGSFSKM